MKITLLLLALAFLSLNNKQSKKWDNFSYVPSGISVVNGDTVSVQSFYMMNYEVTNKEYTTFLKWLEENGSEAELAAAAIRNENWKKELQFSMDQYAKHYHKNEAYEDYPVVNITYGGAKLFCRWLTMQLNKDKKEGQLMVRLPNHAEIIRAGTNGKTDAVYPWNDNKMRNPEGGLKANFKYLPQSQIRRDAKGNIKVVPFDALSASQSFVDLMAPSKSFEKSALGFFNLSGNVAEMINEDGIAVGGSWNDFGYDIRLQSRASFKDVSCMVGFRPVFTVAK